MNFFYKIPERFRYIIQFFRYLIISRHWRGFGIHSPFVYNFYRNILINNRNDANLKRIKKARKSLKRSGRFLYTRDYGTGGGTEVYHYWLSINTAVKDMSISHKYGKILYFLIKHYSITNILEIGTGVGVSTLYMAMGNPSATIRTIEGCPQKAQFARELFCRFGFNQITVLTGNFDDMIPSVLRHIDYPLGLIYVDGNHRKASTLKYFEMVLSNAPNDCIIVFDDIHWSKEMTNAWEAIKNNDKVTATIDLFRLGIVFIKKELSKQNFIIRY